MKYRTVLAGTMREAWVRKTAVALAVLAVGFVVLYAFAVQVEPTGDVDIVRFYLFGVGNPLDPGFDPAAPAQAPTLPRQWVVSGSGLYALALLSPWGVFFALFISISLWNVAFQPQQLYWVLSKPLSRAGFFLSKYAGALAVVGVTSLAFALALSGLIYWKTGILNVGLLLGALIVVFNYATLAALALLLVIWTNNTALSLLLTVLVYVLADGLQSMTLFPFYPDLPAWLRLGLDALYHILPKVSDLEVFAQRLLGDSPIPPEALMLRGSFVQALVSSLAFLLAALGLGAWQFQRKDL